jgi:hypothetical protein
MATQPRYSEERTTIQVRKSDRLLLDESPHYQKGVAISSIVGALIRAYHSNPQIIESDPAFYKLLSFPQKRDEFKIAG